MLWSVIGRILWARRAIVLIALASSLAGGVIVLATAEPRYDATARVMLNVLKPDPITGSRLSWRQLDPYIQSQLKTIRDIQTVGPAIEAVGWMDNPDMLAAYDARPADDPRDYPTWAASSVIAALQAYVVEGSNILEIKFRGSSPELAALVAGAVRDAYISTSIRDRRAAAASDADMQLQRAQQLERELAELEGRKAAHERQTGVILEAGGSDLASASLKALTQPITASPKELFAQPPTVAQAALRKFDSDLAKAASELGANHPKLMEMRQQRVALAIRAEEEARTSQNLDALIAARARATAAEIERQKGVVLDQRQDLLKLRLLQDQINLKRKAYTEMMRRIAALRQMSTSDESGLTSVGEVESQPGRAYPSTALILGGTGGFGLVTGILIALLVELFNLRVRTPAGLRVAAAPLPILGTMPPLREEKPRKARRWRGIRLGRLHPASS